jgi:hypothetical protein
MSIIIDNDLAEAALRAAAKAGFSNVVEGLLEAGVDANSMAGAALVIAEHYGDRKTIEILRRRTTVGPVASKHHG